jgi:hypothetical protein
VELGITVWLGMTKVLRPFSSEVIGRDCVDMSRPLVCVRHLEPTAQGGEGVEYGISLGHALCARRGRGGGSGVCGTSRRLAAADL